jgi:hypothetical protein
MSELKAFVSGQLKEKETVRTIYSRLADLGITTAHDWTTTDNLVGSYSQNPEEAGARAARDIQGVCDADLYILMTDNEFPGKGMYVELGAALVLAETTGSPKVFVVGPRNHESIFYYHPLVTHFPDIDSCLEYIKQNHLTLQ